MEGINIVMTIAIILFARLGMRLLMNYRSLKEDDKNDKWNFVVKNRHIQRAIKFLRSNTSTQKIKWTL